MRSFGSASAFRSGRRPLFASAAPALVSRAMRLRFLPGLLGSIAIFAMAGATAVACGAGGDKNGATGGPDGGGVDGGLQLDGGGGLCNACVGSVYQTCDASGKVTSTTDCAPKTCV